MKLKNVDFPKPLIDALRDNKLVVFAGAGVSMGEPACLPNFKSLTHMIAKGTGIVPHENQKFEEFLGELSNRGVNVHSRAKRILARESLEPTGLHCDLLRLFPRAGQVLLVTTNFDLLFEKAVACMDLNPPEIYRAPALPLAREFEGIIHVHGSVTFPCQMVLTAKDFGHAYLTDGWALRFLVELFNNFAILFVGYSHDDTIMNYLARALMGGPNDQRYALTGNKENKDPNFWTSRGIQPIIYSQSTKEDHSELYTEIHALASFTQRPVAAWKQKIRMIAQAPPPADQDEVDLIDYALGDKIKAGFFTQFATDKEWMDWLNTRKHLDSLFGDGPLNNLASALSRWLASQFVFRHPNTLIHLIGLHGTRLHPVFWQHLARRIGDDTEPSPDKEVLSRWISLLLSKVPEEGPTSDGRYVFTSDCLGSLARRCIQLQMLDDMLLIFATMMQNHLLVNAHRFLPNEAEIEEEFLFSAEISVVGKHDELKELWETGLKPHRSKLAEPLLERVILCLDAQFRSRRGFEAGQLEHASELRPSIGHHDQNVSGEESGVLIDAARDCLEWFVTHQPDVAAHWCNRLAKAESPLQRRLAIHTLSIREDVTPDDKIKWLLDKRFLHEYAIHHEVFHVARQVYSRINSKQRKALIEAVLAYRWKNEEHPDTEEVTAKQHFRWLHWLHRSDENCPLAKRALDEVWKQYPHFRPNEHPDFTSLIYNGYPGLPTPKTAEELLDMPAAECLSYLLSVEVPHLHEVEQRNKANILAEAIRQKYVWSLDLAVSLATAAKWDAYPWSTLFDEWSRMELDETPYKNLLHWLAKTELYSTHSYAITDVLCELAKVGSASYALELLPQAYQIAVKLWSTLDRTASIEECQNWLSAAMDQPAGRLAQFFVSASLIWQKQQDPAPTNLSVEYRETLTNIMVDWSTPGLLGRTVLASKFHLLLEGDEAWTRKHLLPLFDPCSDDFRMAWDGFVRRGQLNPTVAEAMADLFLKAVSHINTNLAHQRRDFVKCYTIMLISFADNPIDKWIPKLLDKSSQEPPKNGGTLAHFSTGGNTTADLFASELGSRLRKMSEAQRKELWQRWLKEYWQNRVEGAPVPLEPSESERMLDWLPTLHEVFPDAVNLAIQMPKTPLQGTRFWFALDRSDIYEKFPQAVAKLLRYLWSCDPEVMKRETDPELLDSLLQSDIPPTLKLDLDDIKAQL